MALHPRIDWRGGVATEPAHRPRSHREHGAWPPERMQQWAGQAGSAIAEVVSRLLDESEYPQERYGSCLARVRQPPS